MDDFDSDTDVNIKINVNENLKNAEESSWDQVLMNGSTREQFEQLAQEYLSEESKKIQSECYIMQQKYLKLQESHKAQQENIRHLEKEINDKDDQILRLENEVNELNVNGQDSETKIAKLSMNLHHNDDVIHSLNDQILEYQHQNDILTQKIHELNSEINTNEQEKGINGECESMNDENDADLQEQQDKIKRVIEENADLKNQIISLESEQKTLSLNNVALNDLLETKAVSLENSQKQHEIIKNKYEEIKHLNEQYLMTMNEKNDFIEQLKEQNENLENLNEETMRINHDLRQDLEQKIHKLTASKSNEDKKKIMGKTEEIKMENKQIVSDRQSCDDDDENDGGNDEKEEEDHEQRRSSVPSSLYAQNLDLIVKSVNKDEYTFMEDLSRERRTLKPTKIRSEMLKRCHSDAEKEFFFMMVLTVKLEISIKNGLTNAILSDVSPQSLWIKAQQTHLGMHEFHKYIHQALISVLAENKKKNEPIIAQWNSLNSMIADELRQNNLKKFQLSNPHLSVIDPEKSVAPKHEWKGKQQGKRERSNVRNSRTLTEQPYSDQQVYFDEDEDEIYAAMKKNGKTKRRDSQKMKKTIIQSYINNEAHQRQQDYDLL